jgi:hypothetical protein
MCSPTLLVGPRGEWSRLTVTETQFTEVTERIFHSDGSVEINQHDPFDDSSSMLTAELSEQDLRDLTQMLNGAALRRLLASPETCAEVLDAEVNVTLELDTTTLMKNVISCPPPDDTVVTTLLELAERY